MEWLSGNDRVSNLAAAEIIGLSKYFFDHLLDQTVSGGKSSSIAVKQASNTAKRYLRIEDLLAYQKQLELLIDDLAMAGKTELRKLEIVKANTIKSMLN